MSQSNDSPAPCASKGGMAKLPFHCAILLVQDHADKRKETATIVDPPRGKRKRNSWVWKVMQQFAPPIGKYSVG